MKRTSVLTLASVLLIGAIWVTVRPYAFLYARQFYRPSLMGKSKDDAIKQVGEPSSIPELGEGDIWIYQHGMSPSASVTFTKDKVSEVWTAYWDGFQ